MKKVFIFIVKLLARFIKIDKDLIVLRHKGYSGSNLSPIISELENNCKEYKVKVINIGKANTDFANGKINKLELFKSRIENYRYTLKSNLIIATHGFYKLRNDTKVIELWHGIPLKSIGLMHKGKTDRVDIHARDDYFISTSEFYNTLINACFGIRAEQYFITGYPRNDYLFKEDGLSNLKGLLNKNIQGKLLMYIPTYRDKVIKEDIFGFDNFNFEEFNKFLKYNDLYILLKLHPYDENITYQNYVKYIGDRVILIKNEDLEKNRMDLYRIINCIDLLITDYSSIYFDYLLLNRPIIFTPIDFEKYKEERGFLLEPYEQWTPGPKCLSQESLQNEIIKGLSNSNYFKEDRERLRDTFHKYQDGNSTKRVMELVKKAMAK